MNLLALCTIVMLPTGYLRYQCPTLGIDVAIPQRSYKAGHCKPHSECNTYYLKAWGISVFSQGKNADDPFDLIYSSATFK